MKERIEKYYWKGIGIYLSIIIILNIVSEFPAFSDFYTDHIFGFWSETYGRLTGFIPFSVGEWLIVLAIILTLLAVILVLLFFPMRRKMKYRKVARKYFKFFLVFLLTVAMIMTLNCSILYRCSKLSLHKDKNKQYGVEELEELRNQLVEKCNLLSQKVPRNKNGEVTASGKIDTEVKKAMKQLAVDYPRFKGYYPTPKKMFASYIMYQAGMSGVYFPFSMEANINHYIADVFYPFTACHELAHLKGYIYENEANFFAYLACIGSENKLLQYSGYLQVLDYVNDDYYNLVGDERYQKQIKIAKQVKQDDHYYLEDTLKQLEDTNSLFSDQVVETVGDTITEGYLDYYGAKANYSEVTQLLLEYYEGKTLDKSENEK